MKYSCSNCKYMVVAGGGWSGFACSRILNINDGRRSTLSSGSIKEAYLCGDESVTMIVYHQFLCVLHEPKE